MLTRSKKTQFYRVEVAVKQNNSNLCVLRITLNGDNYHWLLTIVFKQMKPAVYGPKFLSSVSRNVLCVRLSLQRLQTFLILENKGGKVLVYFIKKSNVKCRLIYAP